MPFNNLVGGGLLWLFLLSCSNEESASRLFDVSTIDTEAIIEIQLLHLNPQEGLVYYQNKPFTGTSISHYSNQQKAALIQYVAGKKNGLYLKWYENGTVSFEANYISGKLNGASKTWWRNGQLRSVGTYENGIVHGTQTQWYKVVLCSKK